MNRIRAMDDSKTKPLDPSDNAADFVIDPSGMTGISDDHDQKGSAINTVKPGNLSNEAYERAFDRGSEAEILDSEEKPLSNEDGLIDKSLGGNDVSGEDFSPSVEGEQEASGTNPDPSSDDDVDQMLSKVGLDGDENGPKELDIASQLDKDEEDIRES
jgi:hypothetical protein